MESQAALENLRHSQRSQGSRGNRAVLDEPCCSPTSYSQLQRKERKEGRKEGRNEKGRKEGKKGGREFGKERGRKGGREEEGKRASRWIGWKKNQRETEQKSYLTSLVGFSVFSRNRFPLRANLTALTLVKSDVTLSSSLPCI